MVAETGSSQAEARRRNRHGHGNRSLPAHRAADARHAEPSGSYGRVPRIEARHRDKVHADSARHRLTEEARYTEPSRHPPQHHDARYEAGAHPGAESAAARSAL